MYLINWIYRVYPACPPFYWEGYPVRYLSLLCHQISKSSNHQIVNLTQSHRVGHQNSFIQQGLARELKEKNTNEPFPTWKCNGGCTRTNMDEWLTMGTLAAGECKFFLALLFMWCNSNIVWISRINHREHWAYKSRITKRMHHSVDSEILGV